MSVITLNQLQPSGEWNSLLSNKVVFVSGGGGYIAQSIAHTCYLHGANIILADINEHAALNVKQKLLTQNGVDGIGDQNNDRILVIGVDVTNENSVKQAVDLVMSKWNKIHILINTYLMTKHIVPIMKQQQESCAIINLASGSGMIAIQNSVPYPATKAAIIQMTKSLALDLGACNIRVISVSPGAIESPTMNHLAKIRNVPEEKVSETYAAKFSKRLGQAQEIANMIVFLISDLCHFCTGTNIVVDGGMNI